MKAIFGLREMTKLTLDTLVRIWLFTFSLSQENFGPSCEKQRDSSDGFVNMNIKTLSMNLNTRRILNYYKSNNNALL